MAVGPMADLSLASFVTIAVTLFVAELTDKDALLLVAVSAKVRARLAFLAGATAFMITTTIIIAAGSLLVAVSQHHNSAGEPDPFDGDHGD